MNALLLVLLVALAVGQEATVEPPREWGPAAEGELAETHTGETVTERGEPPSYDGREKKPPTPGEVLAWVPRVAFAPVYVVERYVVYPPVRAITIWVEKNHIPIRVYNALTFGDAYRFTLVPSALIDFGFRASVGLALVGREFNRSEHRMSLKVAYGGNGWNLIRAGYEVPLSGAARASDAPLSGSLFTADAWYHHRPDYVFHGVGLDTAAERTRFGALDAGGQVELVLVLGEMDAIALRAEVSTHDFDEGRSYEDDPVITERFDIATIPGFDSYTLATGGAELILDSGHGPVGPDNGVPPPATALRLEGRADVGTHHHGSGVHGQYLRWQAEGGVFLDLNGRNRTLAVRQFTSSATPLGTGAPVPFDELVTLGGNETMRGHLKGRFRGASAVVTGVRYTWPIWVILNGSIEAELGGVFGPDFEGADTDAMAVSFAYGVRAPRNRLGNTQVMVGLGTTPLSDGAGVDTVRLVLGSSEGF